METLIIDIPNEKSILVKQILLGLGVTIKYENEMKPSDYARSIRISKKNARKMLKDVSEMR